LYFSIDFNDSASLLLVLGVMYLLDIRRAEHHEWQGPKKILVDGAGAGKKWLGSYREPRDFLGADPLHAKLATGSSLIRQLL
jgi:hypothetical protein